MRFPALESLRGLAALIVVIHHHLLVLPSVYPYTEQAQGLLWWLLFSPLHLLWAGSEAVTFFFVLSGFVLSLNYWDRPVWPMKSFLIRRLWRIWVPFIVAVTLAWLAAGLLGHTPLLGVSPWFNAIWAQAGLAAYLQHLLMLGQMDRLNHAFLPVVWSLKWEMWLSLLFPLVLLIARQPLSVSLPLCVALLALYHLAGYQRSLFTDLARYLPMFVLGAVLARHHRQLKDHTAHWPRGALGLLGGSALLLIPVQWYGWSGLASMGRHWFNDLLTLGAALLLLALALCWTTWQRWLEHRWLTWLGKISFSLYLYHSLVLALVVRMGSGHWPLPWLLVMSFLLCCPVAALMWRWIEQPAIQYGKRF